MATSTIIRYVTQALLNLLQTDLAPILSAGQIVAAPPETVASANGQILILYLYQVLESPFLRNVGPQAVTQPPNPPGAQQVTVQRDPLALDLYYLLIPFSKDKDNNYLDTYDILGAAMKSFHDHGTFSPGALGVDGLTPEEAQLEFRLSPNPLSTSDLLRLWEAVNEPYRLSVAYVVRTVLIDSTLATDGQLVSARRASVSQQ
jgi:Pvc16 N-terminal domain